MQRALIHDEGEGTMQKMVILQFLILLILTIISPVLGQLPSSKGYISIDCGITSGSSYSDSTTKLQYVSDDQYIGTGKNYIISSGANAGASRQELTVRSFPDGAQNCYTLPVTSGNKYLIRAGFWYGNYDGLGSVTAKNQILFNLNLGPNVWAQVNISETARRYTYEVITVPAAKFTSVCLVNTGSGTPFISSLELRPFRDGLYLFANATESLVLHSRSNYVKDLNTGLIRYPEDPYDRIWTSSTLDGCSTNSTTQKISIFTNDQFEVPQAVLQTAAILDTLPALVLPWNAMAPLQYYGVLHFAEIQQTSSDSPRVFDVYIDNKRIRNLTLTPLVATSVYNEFPVSGKANYVFTLRPIFGFPLQPLINALEIYFVLPLTQNITDAGNFNAIYDIKQLYQVTKNWIGDPCSPIAFAWDGISCSYGVSNPQITALNLSSSGLKGTISTSIAALEAIQILDLSYNNLIGQVPDFLSSLSSLKVLNLSWNCLSGPVPKLLLEKVANGNLELRYDHYSDGCSNVPPPPGNNEVKTSIIVPIVVSVAAVVAALLILTLIFCKLKRSKSKQEVPGVITTDRSKESNSSAFSGSSEVDEHRQFTYQQLENITNKFSKVIGKGAFGTVYSGRLDDGREVAVKVLSPSSRQGLKEFHREAHNLTKVHHRYLVTLVGYCKEEPNLALIYEYVPKGNLQEALRGAKPLTWEERLKIAYEVAQGLDYLHRGCSPPIVHRDIKASNILLASEAKLADFGLSMAYQHAGQSHISDASLVGTVGYVDPEYYRTYKLTTKSDVFSFGVILLEIVTGEEPLRLHQDNVHIIDRVISALRTKGIHAVVDKKLGGQYDTTSVQMVIDLAMICTSDASKMRPTMEEVASQLKQILAGEHSEEWTGRTRTKRSSIGESSASETNLSSYGRSISAG